MAIEKRRMQQRYGTYEQFQSDLQNILDHEFISVDSGDTTLEGTTKGLYFKFPGGNPVRIYTTNEMENYNNKFNYYSVSSGGDLDTIKDTGFYNFAGVDGYSNIPDGQTSKIKGTLLVVNHKFTTSTDVWSIEQYWFSSTNEVFARTYSYNEQFSSGSWTSWILIATNINNIVEDINTNLNKKENVSNKVSEITHPSLDYYPNTKAVFDYVNSKLETPLSDIESLKSDKLDKTDFNTYKTTTDKAIADNTNAIDKCVTDLSLSSTGYYNLHCTYKIGSIDKVTGEEKDGSAFITDKLDLSQYSNVTITTDRPTLYASVFEYDSNNKFTKVIADSKNKITFSPVAKYKYIIWLWYGGTDFSKIADVTVIGKAINTIAENDTRYELAKETCKLDLPDAFYIQKGGTLELFKYGMYYSNYEFVENKYNVRLVNLSGYITEYSDKIVINCPADYADETLRKPNDLPLFQLLDRFGKVIDSKRVKIYVADISALANTTRRIMYLGDSLTGMAVRSGETANLISQTTLTDTKLIGRSIGQGSGNKFTGTGGYSWANYTENPNTLPSAYPNNYLWVDSYNNISMSHFIKNTLNETQLDYLVILLGWNDYENGAFASKFNWSDLKMRAKKLIENTHIGFPNCKIILESYHYMYPYKRKSYGNTMPQVRQNKYIYDLNKLYQEIANEYDYVTFVQMSCQIDVLHNMTMESIKVNKRSEKTAEYCKDCVHPANEGFYQYSDAEFTALTYLMTKETPTVEEGE